MADQMAEMVAICDTVLLKNSLVKKNSMKVIKWVVKHWVAKNSQQITEHSRVRLWWLLSVAGLEWITLSDHKSNWLIDCLPISFPKCPLSIDTGLNSLREIIPVTLICLYSFDSHSETNPNPIIIAVCCVVVTSMCSWPPVVAVVGCIVDAGKLSPISCVSLAGAPVIYRLMWLPYQLSPHVFIRSSSWFCRWSDAGLGATPSELAGVAF